jgi:hypothetical protein
MSNEFLGGSVYKSLDLNLWISKRNYLLNKLFYRSQHPASLVSITGCLERKQIKNKVRTKNNF